MIELDHFDLTGQTGQFDELVEFNEVETNVIMHTMHAHDQV